MERTDPGRLEARFDATFASRLALREKQLQQRYRPIIGIHKWFARRPGTLFRALLLAEYGEGSLPEAFFQGHALRGTIADPFMGGGTTLYEASRLGFSVVGNDLNPLSAWLVTRAFDAVDPVELAAAADAVATAVEADLGHLYRTRCARCGGAAQAKSFHLVTVAACPGCGTVVDAFPRRLLAEAERHPAVVVPCAACGSLGEHPALPTPACPSACGDCGAPVTAEGSARRGTVTCPRCAHRFRLPQGEGPPVHRPWALEVHCAACHGAVRGRLFKAPDDEDLARVTEAARREAAADLGAWIPEAAIPEGDETARLHRWGYHRYRDLFAPRQRLVLGSLARAVGGLAPGPVREALFTVLSDTLRYNNLLCRYDTWALKVQDVFSLHGFPVLLAPCENHALGIPGVGSGGFRHFVKKYLRAREYAARPFEVRPGSRTPSSLPEERIGPDPARGSEVTVRCGPSQDVALGPGSLDGVFTDPPYFASVQYAELVDFHYAWLRRWVGSEHRWFSAPSTRSPHEATGNVTAGRGLPAFTEALSAVFRRFGCALKPGAPLVFTYHHNDPQAYAPLVVAVLDAGLSCTAVLPAAAEMAASRHIAGTGSSVLDSVFVCRAPSGPPAVGAGEPLDVEATLERDRRWMEAAGVKVTSGDLRCLRAGHLARGAMLALAPGWDPAEPMDQRLARAGAALREAPYRAPDT